MHIGLGTKCICICLMLGVYEVYVIYVVYVICVNVMYCAWYVHFFNALKLKNYDNDDVLMMLYNLMKNC